jgi:type VI secretion system secreted protein Hcp
LVIESWFLKIDGIDGQATSTTHKGEIDVLSWSWAVTQTASAHGSGSGAGKASFNDFHFVAKISQASPVLLLSCATGTHHKEATLSGSRSAGKSKGADFLKYTLSDVRVTSVQHGDSDGGPPTEQFSLSYSKFEISFQPDIGPAVGAGFDVKLGKKV